MRATYSAPYYIERSLNAREYTARMLPLRQSSKAWLFLVVMASAILGYSAYFSHARILWADEVYLWDTMHDSWSHMFYALGQGADSGGLAFYVLCRLWLKVFGMSFMALRLFSAAGCALGLAFTFLTARRYYRFFIAATVTTVVWMSSTVILWQMVQSRFYGWLLAACAMVLYFAVRCGEERYSTGRESVRLTLLYAVSSLLLVMLHPMGIVTSLSILIGAMGADALRRQFRPWMYASTVTAWLGLLPERQQMRALAEFGKPWFWTISPKPIDLQMFWTPDLTLARRYTTRLEVWSLWLLILLAAAGLLLAIVQLRRQQTVTPRVGILGPALGLSLMPFAIYLYSRGPRTSLFVDRYLICHMVGVAVLSMQAMQTIAGNGRRAFWREAATGIVAAGLLYYAAARALYQYPKQIILPPRDFTVALAERVHFGLPVVIVRPDIFIMMTADNHGPAIQQIYPLDWQIATTPGQDLGLVSGYHQLAAWKLVGYNARSIVDDQQFLAQCNSFLVVDDPAILWMKNHVLNNPALQVTSLGSIHLPLGDGQIYRVDRKPIQ